MPATHSRDEGPAADPPPSISAAAARSSAAATQPGSAAMMMADGHLGGRRSHGTAEGERGRSASGGGSDGQALALGPVAGEGGDGQLQRGVVGQEAAGGASSAAGAGASSGSRQFSTHGDDAHGLAATASAQLPISPTISDRQRSRPAASRSDRKAGGRGAAPHPPGTHPDAAGLSAPPQAPQQEAGGGPSEDGGSSAVAEVALASDGARSRRGRRAVDTPVTLSSAAAAPGEPDTASGGKRRRGRPRGKAGQTADGATHEGAPLPVSHGNSAVRVPGPAAPADHAGAAGAHRAPVERVPASSRRRGGYLQQPQADEDW